MQIFQYVTIMTFHFTILLALYVICTADFLVIPNNERKTEEKCVENRTLKNNFDTMYTNLAGWADAVSSEKQRTEKKTALRAA